MERMGGVVEERGEEEEAKKEREGGERRRRQADSEQFKSLQQPILSTQTQKYYVSEVFSTETQEIWFRCIYILGV